MAYSDFSGEDTDMLGTSKLRKRLRKKVKAIKTKAHATRKALKTKKGRKELIAAIATGGMSRVVRNKKLRSAVAAVATGGMSRALKSKKARQVLAAVATGGASRLFAKKKTKAGKILSAIATGGLSTLKSKKGRKVFAAFATGGLSKMADKKSKVGKAMTFAFAPLTSTIGAVVKKRQARKIAATEAIINKEDAAVAQEAATLQAQETALNQQAAASPLKKALPFVIGAAALLPFLFGEYKRS